LDDFYHKCTKKSPLRVGTADEEIRVDEYILVADEDFRVGERASEDEKCIAFFTVSQ
jgi:hypothetical protein